MAVNYKMTSLRDKIAWYSRAHGHSLSSAFYEIKSLAANSRLDGFLSEAEFAEEGIKKSLKDLQLLRTFILIIPISKTNMVPLSKKCWN